MIRWKLKEFMEVYRLRPGQLARATEGKLSRAGVYGLVSDDHPQSVYFATLDVLIPALRKLIGDEVGITDLLEYVDETAPTMPKQNAWRQLAGALDDPASPGDIAERHGEYLGAALRRKYDA